MPAINDPPFEQVEGISNFRSIGGYPISSPSTSHRSTLHNFIYRSADPSKITPAGRSKIQSLGITTVYDLRSQLEVDKQLIQTPSALDPLADGVTRRFVPVFANEDWSPEAIASRHAAYADTSGPQGYVSAYSEMLENGGPAFREILLHIRDRPNDALLCHCSAGKDRTGIAVALALKIAGVADEVVARDYALSEVGLEGRKAFIIEHLMKNGGDREKAEKVASAKYENMLASLEMIGEKYGGAEGYAKSHCGLRDEDIGIIRKNLISEDPPSITI